ncbi:Uncharacterised protein [uncultured archaeon]|nr:Uncharacterised protein [uncultured archaeon]
MDVFKLQKINSLAKELRSHNFADSSDSAFQQAEQVFEPSVQQVVVEEKPVIAPRIDVLSERKFEMLLEQNNKRYEQEIGLLRSALGTLANEIECLKSELKKMSEQNPKPKEHQEPLKTEVKPEHPRQGKFTSSDVDIQKMFYFGAKR